jgi:hypothetical protein
MWLQAIGCDWPLEPIVVSPSPGPPALSPQIMWARNSEQDSL